MIETDVPMMVALDDSEAWSSLHYNEPGTSRTEADCLAMERSTSALPPDMQRVQQRSSARGGTGR